eukprot:7049586-Lingulodinium_polyedra.AAC.1
MSASISSSSVSLPELPMKPCIQSPPSSWTEKARKGSPVAQRQYWPKQGARQLPFWVEPPRVS